ncbi:MAG: polysaccharide biosynthesis C-terminal domain-containing protein [Saprospiraceae bacterium]
MKRSFLINITLLLLANLLIKPFYLFGIERKLQYIVGNIEYGHYYNVLSFTLILQFINDFGIQNYTSRLISQNRIDANTHAKSLVSFKLILSFFYLILTFIVAGLWYGSKLDLSLVMHLTLNQILISLIFFLRSNISGLGLYRTDTLLSILDRSLLILMMGSLIYFSDHREWINISLFVWIQTISLAICVVLSVVILVYNKYHFKIITISYSEFKSILNICLPFALIYISSVFFMKSESIWLEKLLYNGVEESGIYASCFRLYDALCILALSFSALLLAMFANLYSDSERLKELLSLSIRILFVIAIFCSLFGIFYINEISQMLNTNSNSYSNNIFILLLLAFIPGSINYIFGAYYQACHKEKTLVKIYFTIAIISIALNFITIPTYRAQGSAFAYLCSQIILFIISIYLIRNDLSLLFKEKIKILLFCLSLILLFYLISSYSGLHFYFQVLILSLGTLLILFLTRVIEINQVKKLWSMKNNS